METNRGDCIEMKSMRGFSEDRNNPEKYVKQQLKESRINGSASFHWNYTYTSYINKITMTFDLGGVPYFVYKNEVFCPMGNERICHISTLSEFKNALGNIDRILRNGFSLKEVFDLWIEYLDYYNISFQELSRKFNVDYSFPKWLEEKWKNG